MEPPSGSILTQAVTIVWSEMSKDHEAHEGEKTLCDSLLSPLSNLRCTSFVRGE